MYSTVKFQCRLVYLPFKSPPPPLRLPEHRPGAGAKLRHHVAGLEQVGQRGLYKKTIEQAYTVLIKPGHASNCSVYTVLQNTSKVDLDQVGK